MKRPSEQDIRWMREALRLARRGEGLTRPNPPVGAIVVRNNRVVGMGWHRRAGGPHAEIYALKQAGSRARGATLYVTLEPCSTFGRTPPCTETILQSGISRVVVAIVDPNPRHSGRGIRLLRRAGVAVNTGICADEARELIAPFARWIRDQHPYVVLKLGLSLDGRLADYRHLSRWITGPKARARVQEMRRTADAIMVGANTVRYDNPSLWPRPPKGRIPLRIIVVREHPLPLSAQVFTDPYAEHTLVAAPVGWQPRIARQLRAKGIEVVELPAQRFLPALFSELGRRGILKVLCEGGGILAGALLKAQLVDELCLFLSPQLLGGPVGATGNSLWPLSHAPRFILHSCQDIGGDLWLRYFPKNSRTLSASCQARDMRP